MFQKMYIYPYLYTEMLHNIKQSPDKGESIILDNINRAHEKTSEFCLSKDFHNVLIWARRADNNKGVCIEFDILHNPCFFYFQKM